MRGSIRPRQGKKGITFVVVHDEPSSEGRKQRRRSFKTREAAEAYLATALGDVYAGRYVAPTTTTVGQFIDHWVASLEPGDKPSPATIEMYRVCLNRVRPLIGGVPLAKLDVPRLTKTMNAAQAADALGCARTTMLDLLASGQIHGVKANGRWYVTEQALRDFQAGRTG